MTETVKHSLEARSQSSPRFTASGESFAVEFVIMKHLAFESLHLGPSCSLDIALYMLKYIFAEIFRF